MYICIQLYTCIYIYIYMRNSEPGHLSCTGFVAISATNVSEIRKEVVAVCLKHVVVCLFRVNL